jgi:hypothetical protein
MADIALPRGSLQPASSSRLPNGWEPLKPHYSSGLSCLLTREQQWPNSRCVPAVGSASFSFGSRGQLSQSSDILQWTVGVLQCVTRETVAISCVWVRDSSSDEIESEWVSFIWVNTWVCKSVWAREIVNECMTKSQRVFEWVRVWMNEWMCEWTSECVDDRVCESVWVTERANELCVILG